MTVVDLTVERVAVAIASFRDVHLLEACLGSIAIARARLPRAPLVFVARAGPAEPVRHLFEKYPWATLVPAADGANIPRLRGTAMSVAGGGWIAVTEDHCVAEPSWLERLYRHVGGPFQVIGGGVGNTRDGMVNWGAYFSEYGFFSPARPAAAGLTSVTGANVMYGPLVSQDVATWATQGTWENVIHDRLAAQGVTFRFEPSAVVRQNAIQTFWAFCHDRYCHGYDYARDRIALNPREKLWVRLASSPLLPAVLLARIMQSAARGNGWIFLKTVPCTTAFLSAWAVGEASGYWSEARGK